MELKIRSQLFLLLLCFYASTTHADSPTTHVADFENYSEGATFNSIFPETKSQIFFSNANSISHSFVIEYGNNLGPQSFFNSNKYLTSNGFSPGDGISLAGNFAFTAYTPGPANHISMDIAAISNSATPCTVTLSGYSIDDQLIASDSFTLPNTFGPTIHTFQIDSTSYNITRFTTSLMNLCSAGYDNITLTSIPEPSFALALFLSPLLLHRARGNRKQQAGQSCLPSCSLN